MTRLLRALSVSVAGVALLLGVVTPAGADSFVPISGAGSTWSQNALDQWIRNVAQFGLKVNYAGTGSSDGRNQFRNGTVDFGVSEIPYGLRDGNREDPLPTRKFAYMPIVAGGTSFMYNLSIGGKRVTNLRLSGDVVAKMFTGQITRWDDPAIKADNPGLALPGTKVVPVVRSDGSGTTAQFTTWMSKQYPAIWDAYCAKAGRTTPCGTTSTYPVIPGSGFTAQSGSTGVAGYVKQGQSVGAITYVEYSYALNADFPVVKVLNAAGYYTEPTASNVAVALLAAQINNDPNSPQYLTQLLEGVYRNPDARTYPLSSYSYMIVPTEVSGTFTTQKGRTLAAFADYFLCEGQQQAEVLGYSPLPVNLVQAGLTQVRRIPGAEAQNTDIAKCNNPTFSADGTNVLAKNAPQPQACDKKGPTQCTTGTGGAKAATPTSNTAGAGGAKSGGSSSGSGTSAGTAGAGSSGSGATTDTGATGSSGAGAVDPDTGAAVAADGTSLAVSSVPVTLPPDSGWSMTRTLMLLAALLLIGVVLIPPLLARRLNREQGS